MAKQPNSIEQIKQVWSAAWPEAVAVWNPYVTLREPTWCLASRDAHLEGLTSSFAMIRLTDHRIVIDLESVRTNRVENCALQILAHEIGHHVLIPANRYDNIGVFRRMRLALAGIEDRVPFVANLYSDLIINDALQRIHRLDMASVYMKIQQGADISSSLYMWYMRTYEYLWGLGRGVLSGKKQSPQIDADASLAASLIRSYARSWLDGAGRFAMLAYPYLIEDSEYNKARKELAKYLDAEKSGEGSEVAGGMAEIDESILEGIVDPRAEALDDRIKADSGGDLAGEGEGKERTKPSSSDQKSLLGGTGPRQRYLEPGVYIDMMRQVDPTADDNKLIIRYYRDIAMPYLVPFPVEESLPLAELLPEGTEQWEPGDPVEELDWFETTVTSPVVVPGITTRRRVYTEDVDAPSKPQSYNLYVGIDCSGSMRNPRYNFSWPICAGTIVSLSALRAGAKVMGCLSGEPGSFLETDGFVKSEHDVLNVLTSYLGTGYAYGIPRLQTPHLDKVKRKTHLLIVSDDDIFSMLQATGPDGSLNYDIAERALLRAGGGGTFVLHSSSSWHSEGVKKLEKMGWAVHYVTKEEEMVEFARAFARQFYNKTGKRA
ncbi:MAG: hypothetical protein CVV41_18250 [Candidatus Riflebacteria bacterium HGW-Riflebacteria-1]|nr:MAG: hypothetical protein CVV41_18250 [Candidatus Riflebacteria bacterium HGW-Riflebacteria-1]